MNEKQAAKHDLIKFALKLCQLKQRMFKYLWFDHFFAIRYLLAIKYVKD